ncbi:class I SAM-dependent methyltransferase [Patescibacteria group bacterium]|nr:class I SAM-dependent methyltransferase [Patescibacteria group bacterium]
MPVPPDYYDQGIKKNLLQFIWHKRRFWLIESLLPKVGTKVLDVGCHAGTFTEEIARVLPEAEIFGVDIDRAVIAYAKKIRPNFHFQVASAEKLPFPEKSFDLITCLEVLEHVGDPKKVLAEIKRCLKDDGLLTILVPTESPLFRLIWFFWTKGKGRVWQGTHLHNFNGYRLDSLLGEGGFEIKERKFSHLGMLQAVKVKKV